jgi:HEAT repeat protein
MQAAVTLGRLGVPGDEQLLVAILSDQQWWVRYRAAQALMTLGFVNIDGMRRILNSQTDNYARDIIKHVLAEGAMIKQVVTKKTTAAA